MKKLLLLLAAAGLLIPVTQAQTIVTVDSSSTWLGYMVVFNTDPDGGAYMFESGWGFNDLDATFGPGGELTLAPNTNIARDVPTTDTFWFDSVTLKGNKKMQATGYVEDLGLLGQTVNFEYNVLSNTLDGSSTETGSYTAIAFIKILDSNAGFSEVSNVEAPLTPGANTLSLAIPNTPGYIPQYGFRMVGDNAPTVVNSLGSVVVVPEPTTYAALLGLAVLGLVMYRRRK